MAKKPNIKKKVDTKKKVEVAKKTKIKKVSRIPLREKKIREIKKKLIAQRKALLAEAIDALNELPGQTVFPDLGDQASAEIDRSFMLRLRGRERKLLKKIDGAIERIDQGTFGICDKCGEEINIKRLEARPVTNMCIECKTQQEEEERLMET
jgi:DnaK suppressor protein